MLLVRAGVHPSRRLTTRALRTQLRTVVPRAVQAAACLLLAARGPVAHTRTHRKRPLRKLHVTVVPSAA